MLRPPFPTFALPLALAVFSTAAAGQTQVWSTPATTEVWSDAPAPAARPDEAPKTGVWSDDLVLPHTPREPAAPAAPAAPEAQQTFKPGDEVFVGEPGTGMSYPGVVDRVREGEYFVRFSGTIGPSDQWVDARRVRAPPSPRREVPLPGFVKAGARVEVLSKGQWYGAKILEVSGATAKVRYDRYDASWDEWITAERVRAGSGQPSASPQPTGRFVCQVFEENQLKPQGEFVLEANGTYRDLWNKKGGTWRFERGTGVIRFDGVLANGATATYDPEARHGLITFDWGGGNKRWCYR